MAIPVAGFRIPPRPVWNYRCETCTTAGASEKANPGIAKRLESFIKNLIDAKRVAYP